MLFIQSDIFCHLTKMCAPFTCSAIIYVRDSCVPFYRWFCLVLGFLFLLVTFFCIKQIFLVYTFIKYLFLVVCGPVMLLKLVWNSWAWAMPLLQLPWYLGLQVSTTTCGCELQRISVVSLDWSLPPGQRQDTCHVPQYIHVSVEKQVFCRCVKERPSCVYFLCYLITVVTVPYPASLSSQGLLVLDTFIVLE